MWDTYGFWGLSWRVWSAPDGFGAVLRRKCPPAIVPEEKTLKKPLGLIGVDSMLTPANWRMTIIVDSEYSGKSELLDPLVDGMFLFEVWWMQSLEDMCPIDMRETNNFWILGIQCGRSPWCDKDSLADVDPNHTCCWPINMSSIAFHCVKDLASITGHFRKAPVDFEIFTHYAGEVFASFTQCGEVIFGCILG